jgi:glycosyltransferase involved in cell wall biosynthesis
MRKDTLIIIPAFNEEKNIANVINNIFSNYKEADILVVNDGSTDTTAEILETKGVSVINHIFNMGIGVSFETGCKFALNNGYDYIVRMDGDGQHDASFIKDIIKPIRNNEVDISIGSRFLEESEFTTSSFRLIGIKILSLILTIVTQRKITDPTSGFCAMNKKAFEFFSSNCVEDYPEPEILVFHRDFRIKEVPISVKKRWDGISSITPLKSIYYMIKVLFSLFVSLFRKEK